MMSKKQRKAEKAYAKEAEAANRNMEDDVTMPVLEDDELELSSGFCVGHAQIVGTRKNQEDSYVVSNLDDTAMIYEKGLLAVVADGIGGLNAGEIASKAAIDGMCNCYSAQNGEQGVCERLLEMVGAAQKAVLVAARNSPQCGSTLVGVLVRQRNMAFVSVGDSRICLYRAGALLQLNREHILARDADEASVLANAPANTDARKRKALTAFMGKANLRLIDRNTSPMRLIRGDRILLMSDGVFGTLNDDELISMMDLPPQAAAESIVRAVDAKRREHQDNATIVIVEIE